MLQKVKTALRVSTPDFDDEIATLIEAGKEDLELSGVIVDIDKAICQRAIITYCLLNFGTPSEPDRLKKSYDEQKAQLMVATGFTDWGDDK